ncbi:MAG: short-chain fatty acid transporter [Deltaproteobacteria bacterium]|nr:short-chain fatty acid transporter [Deltaproteobacteria bacterium]
MPGVRSFAMGLLDGVRDLGTGLSRWTERWVPDAWVFCMALTVVALLLAILGAGATVEEAVLAWGEGLWNLLALAMQFTIAMVAAHACVSSRPVFNLLDRLASTPDPERPLQAVALAGAFSLLTSYLNWAFCLVACALFVPFLCRRNPHADVRLLIAGCYLGLGTVWHGGFSGSAPLILATPGNPLLAPASGAPIVDRLYPVTETLFHPFNAVYLVAIAAVAMLTTLALHPRRSEDRLTLRPEQVDAILPRPPDPPRSDGSPRGRIEGFRGWVWLAALLIAYPLGHSIATQGFGTSWTINAYNAAFLVAALLLHGRPLAFLGACRRGMDAAWGIVVQFPFYAGIFGIMVHTGLGTWIGDLFARLASQSSYPFVVYAYSGLMNLFVPSAGSKWLIEAPFLIPAGEALDVSVVTVLLAYAYGDSTTNLIQPFWAIPILAVTRLRFGDVVGYLLLIAAACFLASSVAMALIPAQL